MGIKFKYDAAGVTPPSNQSTRKFGQQLVLGEQQRKYQGQQQGYDRLFQLGRDVQQNAFQVDRDNRIADFQQQQAVDQGLRQAGRDKTLFDRQQRAKDFADARARIDTYAKEVVNDPSTPQEVRTKIQNLLSGKIAVLAGGYEAPAQQQFLDQYNSQLAGYLSEIPPKAPPPTPNEEFQQSVATDPETGMRYRKNTKGEFEPLEQPKQDSQPQRFMSADEAFRADPNTRKDYMDQAIEMETNGGEDVLTPELRKKAADTARRNYEEDYGIGTPEEAPLIPEAPPATPGQSRSILETGQPAGIAPGSALARQRDALGMNATSPAAAQPAMGGQPPAAAAYDERMTGQGYELITPTDGTKPYYYKDGNTVYPSADGSRSMSGPASVMNAETQTGMPSPTQRQPAPEAANWDSQQPSQTGITMESASMASKQYESAAQQLQALQATADSIDGQIRVAKGKGGRSGILSSNQNQRLSELKKEQQRIKTEMQSTQKMMQDADKAVRGYNDQQVAQQPAAQKLAKAGKRPQDFAEAEFQLRNLRKQYPDMSSMPPEAKKQLQDAMAVIQAGR